MSKNFFERFFKPPEKPRVLDPTRFKVELGSFPLAESGSRVFKGRRENGSDCIFKIYNITPVTHEELGMYQRLSTEAARVLRDKGAIVKLRDVNGNETKFQIEIVPIEEVGVLPDGDTPCSVGEYIEGFNLDELAESEEISIKVSRKV